MAFNSLTLGQWSLLLLLSILWGSSFIFIEYALLSWPVELIVLIRVSLAALFLWLYILFKGLVIPRSLSIWLPMGLLAIFNNVLPFSLIVWGQQQISAGLASILNATTPIFTLIIASVYLKDEPLTGQKLLAVGVGLLGVCYMVGLFELRQLSLQFWAQLAVLAAAACYAIAAVLARNLFHQQLEPVVFAAGQLSAATVLLLPTILWLEWPTLPLLFSAPTWWAIGGLALFSTAIAYILYFSLLAKIGASHLLLVTMLIPVTSIVLSSYLFAQQLSLQSYFGMGLIALALVLIDGRLFKALVSTK